MAEAQSRRPWTRLIGPVLVAVAVGAAVITGRSTVGAALETLPHLRWWWLVPAVALQAGSMGCFARTQRRMLGAGGVRMRTSSAVAITYAGNAVTVSVPLAGSEAGTAYVFNEFEQEGADAGTAGWALAMAGMVSSCAFATVVAGGALLSGQPRILVVGLATAAITVVPTAFTLAAVRRPALRQRVVRRARRIAAWSTRHLRHPKGDPAASLDKMLSRAGTLTASRRDITLAYGLALGNWLLDCACLACAIAAVGVPVPWSGVLVVYAVGCLAGTAGLTPGGVGSVEAVLAFALTRAGVATKQALASVLIYRFISFWLVLAAGLVVLATVRRHRARTARRRGATGGGAPEGERPSAAVPVPAPPLQSAAP